MGCLSHGSAGAHICVTTRVGTAAFVIGSTISLPLLIFPTLWPASALILPLFIVDALALLIVLVLGTLIVLTSRGLTSLISGVGRRSVFLIRTEDATANRRRDFADTRVLRVFLVFG